MEEVLRDIQILASDTEEVALVISDLLGICRVIKNYYIKEGPTSKVLKTILRKHVKGLYNEFTVLLKLYAGKSTKNYMILMTNLVMKLLTQITIQLVRVIKSQRGEIENGGLHHIIIASSNLVIILLPLTIRQN